MRTYLTNIFFLLLLPYLLAAQSAGKVALVVALSKYAPGSNWPPTNAANDVPLVVNSLVQQGFDNNNIRVLQDAAATKAGIENAIRTMLLANATAGGTLVLHFSGHGQQVQDDNGDPTASTKPSCLTIRPKISKRDNTRAKNSSATNNYPACWNP
ncbi:MAG: hypothetical protein EPGJADBJ_01519 [Saprospiraceae bacterium]|nr:hypothetical protein [Saprospiraceae bacterium]